MHGHPFPHVTIHVRNLKVACTDVHYVWSIPVLLSDHFHILQRKSYCDKNISVYNKHTMTKSIAIQLLLNQHDSDIVTFDRQQGNWQ